MTYGLVVELSRQAVLTAFWLAAPLLTVALGVGLTVSIIQTVTQIQEQTVAFVLKLFAVGVVMFVMLPWSLTTAVQFSTQLFRAIPALVS